MVLQELRQKLWAQADESSAEQQLFFFGTNKGFIRAEHSLPQKAAWFLPHVAWYLADAFLLLLIKACLIANFVTKGTAVVFGMFLDGMVETVRQTLRYQRGLAAERTDAELSLWKRVFHLNDPLQDETSVYHVTRYGLTNFVLSAYDGFLALVAAPFLALARRFHWHENTWPGLAARVPVAMFMLFRFVLQTVLGILGEVFYGKHLRCTPKRSRLFR